MTLLAIVDATGVGAPQGLSTPVAGLSLLERTTRLAEVVGADEIIIVLPPAPSELPDDFDHDSRAVPTRLIEEGSEYGGGEPPKFLLILDAGTVFQRSWIQDLLSRSEGYEPGQASSDSRRTLCLARPDPTHLSKAVQNPAMARQRARPKLDGGWALPIRSSGDAKKAAQRLWNGCRKAQDGLVSRHLNRHLSLFISRRLASTRVKPNHITALTFALGIAAAAAAAGGHYSGFLLAGLLYQANSVIDGVDGELARVRYEFSFLGEWLDTISDDLADFFLYLGLGIGAWRTLPDAPGPWGSEVWLVLGVVAAASKSLSMLVYYRWLIARGRGDLLAFQWSFDNDANNSPLSRFLSFSRYFFRKDFIVFVAMILGIVGFLPHLLFALAPGNAIIAFSVVVEQLRGTPDSS